MGHFGKIDEDCPGLFQYLECVTAQYLKKRGCKYMNYEQDLGLPGLRESKISWGPSFFLKNHFHFFLLFVVFFEKIYYRVKNN